ncbi:MAG: ATP-binding cassette domain-containing protein, partial [Pseudomonadota bacterium]|nr:ATP-binding cassette domain-containing protein [Pseudomonadota bacterium]
MIEVDIQKTLGTFTLNARFGAAAGKVTALFGRSGAGKTTAIDCIAGLARPDGGRVVINGTTVFDHDGRVNRPVEVRRVGYVFQEARLFPHMPVADNLTYGRRQTDGPP